MLITRNSVTYCQMFAAYLKSNVLDRSLGRAGDTTFIVLPSMWLPRLQCNWLPVLIHFKHVPFVKCFSEASCYFHLNTLLPLSKKTERTTYNTQIDEHTHLFLRRHRICRMSECICITIREHDLHLTALWIQFETHMCITQVGLSQSFKSVALFLGVGGDIFWKLWESIGKNKEDCKTTLMSLLTKNKNA